MIMKSAFEIIWVGKLADCVGHRLIVIVCRRVTHGSVMQRRVVSVFLRPSQNNVKFICDVTPRCGVKDVH